jgi:O-antigen ligase
MILLGLIGATALFLMYVWLLSAICASYLSERKGYGEKPGLASGLILTFVGALIWLIWPARPDSKWKTLGPFGRGGDAPKRKATAD